MLRTVTLSGELGKLYGHTHYFDISTPAEALRALSANFASFARHMATAHERNIGYQIVTGGEELATEEDILKPAGREIKIVPVIMGSSAGIRVLVGAALIAVGMIPGFQPLIGVGASLALGGVIEMLSPVPKIKEPSEDPKNKPSYLFNGPVNTTAQGQPVPIGYGRLIVGSAVVSAGIHLEQVQAGYKRIRTEVTVRIEEFEDWGSFNIDFKSPVQPPTVYVSRTLIHEYIEGTTCTFNYNFQEVTDPVSGVSIGGVYDFTVRVYDYVYYTYSVVPA